MFQAITYKLAQDIEERRGHGKWAVDITVVDNELGGFVFSLLFLQLPSETRERLIHVLHRGRDLYILGVAGSFMSPPIAAWSPYF